MKAVHDSWNEKKKVHHKHSNLQPKNSPTINMVQTIESMFLVDHRFAKNECILSLRANRQKIKASNHSMMLECLHLRMANQKDSCTTPKCSCNTLYNDTSYSRTRWDIRAENLNADEGYDWLDSVAGQIFCRLCMEVTCKYHHMHFVPTEATSHEDQRMEWQKAQNINDWIDNHKNIWSTWICERWAWVCLWFNYYCVFYFSNEWKLQWFIPNLSKKLPLI